MKKMRMIAFIMVVFLLAGCIEERETVKESIGMPEENEILISKIHTLEKQTI